MRLAAAGLALLVPLLPPQPASHDYPIHPVSLTAVTVTGGFWAPKIATNRAVTIPHILAQNDATGRIENFLKAAHNVDGAYTGLRYDDTDIYKAIEAASYALAASRDPALDKTIDDFIAIVAAAQEPDGYLYAGRTADPSHPAAGAGPERWSWLHTSHELYNQGHLYEAAVAHFQAAGKRTRLNVAIRSADLVCRTFGPNGRRDVPGHEAIELALVKLFRATGDRKYLDEAKFFVDQRGRAHNPPLHVFAPFAMYNDLAYRQDHKPVVDQTEAVGHAVRATYLYSAMTDAAVSFDDDRLAHAVDALWKDVASKKRYLTGGLGAVGGTEAFGADYVLPNRAYAQTCASVGGLLWYQRMFLRTGDPSYYDTFARTLYNGLLSGVSLSGDRFFYQNPLVSDGRVERAPYFDVACCPANLARLIGELPGLVYAQRDDELFVNLFLESDVKIAIGGATVAVAQRTEYPWGGRVSLRIDPSTNAAFALAIRIPGWARGEASPGGLYRFVNANAGARRLSRATLSLNGKPIPLAIENGFARGRRRWQKDDVVARDVSRGTTAAAAK